MKIENLRDTVDKRLAQKKGTQEAFERGARFTNSKIKHFIKLLQHDPEYKDSGKSGVFINLGKVSDFIGLPDFVADFLGKSEKKDEDEHVMVRAYKGDGSHHLKVCVGTSRGIDRYIDVKTQGAWNTATMDVLYYASSSEREPESITSALFKGRALIQGADCLKEKLKIGEKLVDFAIQETVRVMSPPEDRH